MKELSFPNHSSMNSEMRTIVADVVFGVLNDPDFGLDLSKEARGRLERARKSTSRGIPLSEIKKRYAL